MCGIDGYIRLGDGHERQFDGPVVGKVQYPPCAVIETMLQGPIFRIMNPILACLRERALAHRCTPAKILRSFIRVSKMKAPAEIKQHFLAPRYLWINSGATARHRVFLDGCGLGITACCAKTCSGNKQSRGSCHTSFQQIATR